LQDKLLKNLGDQNPSSKANALVLKEMKLFFGPARFFNSVFKDALLFSVTLKQRESLFKFNFNLEPIFESILRNMVLG
jgi:hypothetical protein